MGSTITFDEQVEYVLSFPAGNPSAVARRIVELGGEVLGPNTGVLGFGNFIGCAELAGVAIDVVSSKIGPLGVSRLLEDVSELGSTLVFGRRDRTSFAAMTDESRHPPVPYHQFQFLRRAMMTERTGQRLQDWLGAIERSPTRRFEPDRPIVRLDQVRRIDQRATTAMFSHLDRLVPVAAGSTLLQNSLARALTFGDPPQAHLPAQIAAPRGRLSFDTPENRFVKHVLDECLALVYRFVDHPQLHGGLSRDCRTMLGTLVDLHDAPFLRDVDRLTRFDAPSQALAKTDGYREVFVFWMNMIRHASLPRTVAEVTQLLDGKDMASLYEYWVFVKVLEATVAVTGRSPSGPPSIHRDEFGESLSIGLSMRLGSKLTLRFNPSFRRSAGTTYSTPLRPDVIIDSQRGRHAFDAKFRLDRFETAENDADDGLSTYKRVDLYKMHTYRDAIAGLKTAFVVYPGTEFVFFERSGVRRTDPTTVALADGVGAVPLRPVDADPGSTLRRVLAVLVSP